jgi:hypothetical protein
LRRSDERSFWATTGLFPQEVIIKLAEPAAVDKIKIVSTNGKTWRVRGGALRVAPLAAQL